MAVLDFNFTATLDESDEDEDGDDDALGRAPIIVAGAKSDMLRFGGRGARVSHPRYLCRAVRDQTLGVTKEKTCEYFFCRENKYDS